MLRLLTYNLHRCIGTDGRLDPGRIAEVIARAGPDLVALQELDVGRARTGKVDQAQTIADRLGMQFHFHPALTLELERYGDAILSRLPMRLMKAAALPGLPHQPLLEPRGALWVMVTTPEGTEVQVVNTHLGLLAGERMVQVEALLGGGWLGHPDCTGPVVLLGDFNAIPRSRAYLRLAGRLRDAQAVVAAEQHGQRVRPTFPTRWPILRLDHVFVSRDLHVRRAEVRTGPLERVASDHLPLLVEIDA
jgi:endonuclease/exonuclease/phosphatase family metal-dependent hydrolase